MKRLIVLISFLLIIPINSYTQLKQEEKIEDPFKFSDKITIPDKYREKLFQEKSLKKNLPPLNNAEKISWSFRKMKRQILL